jgi:SAM-dependent methyltransferase
VTLQGPGRAAAFSTTADAYAATMAPALEPVAREVVRRARLLPGERVLDLGTGTGTAAGLAAGEGRHVTGLDAAPGMLEIARRTYPDLDFIEADFGAMPLPDATFDALLAVHALLFADDTVAALAEWRRVTRPGGRISLSVPGPQEASPSSVLGSVYERFGIGFGNYPGASDVAGWATDAGWSDVVADADETVAIPLADDDEFRTWTSVAARERATAGWSAEDRERLTRELMAAAPRAAGGGYRIPFGAIYVTAARA